MDTGTRSLRRALRKGSCSDWPLAIGFSLFSRFLIVRSAAPADVLECGFSKLRTAQAAVPNNGAHSNTRPRSALKLTQRCLHFATECIDRGGERVHRPKLRLG